MTMTSHYSVWNERVDFNKPPNSTVSLTDLVQLLLTRLGSETMFLTPSKLEDLESLSLCILTDVRSALNLSRPLIHRLPVEILREILSYVPYRDDDRGCDDFLTLWDSPSVQVSDCVHLMSVCRLWRNIVSDCASLWNNVRNFTPCGSLCAVRRSSPSFHIFERPGDEDAETLLHNPLNVGDLRVVYRYTLPLDYLKAPAPLLHTLVVFATSTEARQACVDGASNVLFDGHTPSLRRLALHSLNPLPQNNFANLTHVLLKKITQLDPARLLNWLAASPHISDLVFVETFCSAWDGTYPDMPPLKFLRRLVLADCLEEQFIWVIALPALTPRTAIRLDNVKLVPRGSAVPPYPAGRDIVRLALRTDGMMALSSTSGLLHQKKGEQPWFDGVHSRISLSAITEFWWLFGYSRANTASHLRQFLTSMPALETLIILGRDLPHVMAILSPTTAQYTGGPSPTVPCPHLTTLRVIISSPIWPHRYELPTSSGLARFIAARAESGHPIEHLVLESLPYEDDPPDPAKFVDGVVFEWKKHVEWASFEMTLPDVCARSAHPYWPAWSVFAE
ncbi:hypothetical protein CERSUDRAFT_99825 [Gelatoporia subvermispora B]|uniref:F-box domain-containing protein n=1 Tax=Ceriporiopsis subvermispora (strain B) TaxID=914234 RepID=M2QJ53_CERS8|nr:hypothetical protein CERSUDRAFT_99825 [Gelatoporia subvermispora B]